MKIFITSGPASHGQCGVSCCCMLSTASGNYIVKYWQFLLGIWLCTTHSYLPRHKLWWDSDFSSITKKTQCSYDDFPRTHRQVDWNAQLLTTRWSRWGARNVQVFVLAVYSKATIPPWAALKFLPPNTNPPIPWHRVISASGTISSRGPGTTGAQRQRDALQAEGVQVTTGRTGEMRVNLSQFGWFPSITELNLQDAHRRDDDDGSETWYIYIYHPTPNSAIPVFWDFKLKPLFCSPPPLGFPMSPQHTTPVKWSNV